MPPAFIDKWPKMRVLSSVFAAADQFPEYRCQASSGLSLWTWCRMCVVHSWMAGRLVSARPTSMALKLLGIAKITEGVNARLFRPVPKAENWLGKTIPLQQDALKPRKSAVRRDCA